MKKFQKENGASNVVVILLVIIILMLIICIASLLINSKVKYVISNEPINETTKLSENKETISSENTEMTSEEKYKIFANNLKKEVSQYGDTNNIKSVLCRTDNENNIQYQVSLSSNGNVKLKFGDDKLEKKYGTDSLVSNVLALYVIDVGQDDWHQVYFIKEDGTVSSVNIDSIVFTGSGEMEIKNNMGNLKNIVSIIDGGTGLKTSGTHCPLFIDIEGNVFDI